MDSNMVLCKLPTLNQVNAIFGCAVDGVSERPHVGARRVGVVDESVWTLDAPYRLLWEGGVINDGRNFREN